MEQESSKETPKFTDIKHLLRWAADHRTGRIKRPNLLEPERGDSRESLDGAVEMLFKRIDMELKLFDPGKREAFQIVWIDYFREIAQDEQYGRDSEIRRQNPYKIAQRRIGRSLRSIYRWIEEVEDHLEDLFIRRGEIIPKPDTKFHEH